MKNTAICSMLLGGVFLASGASAADYITDAKQALGAYNLITLGDLNGGHHVQGRTYVGGVLNSTGGNTEIGSSLTGSGTIPTLTVAGKNAQGYSVTGNVLIQKGPEVLISGSASSFTSNDSKTVISAGGTVPAVQNNMATVKNNQSDVVTKLASQKAALATNLKDLSTTLKNTAATCSAGCVTFSDPGQNGKLTFSNLGNGLNVVNVTAAQLGTISLIQGTVNGFLVINVSGASATLNDTNNLVNRQNVLWNFTDATALTFSDRQFFGSVLATKANATQLDNVTMDGNFVFQSITQTNEIHLPSSPVDYSVKLTPVPVGPVPEPASWAMMIAGFGLIGGALRRRNMGSALAA
ncbi:collagen-binding domain-containing protein [Sphingomonas sp. ID0503]|uniref:collagen-binding domain-containing protein n=1 Tax=Sphingomonas sp. ID0503 TaxID=3399691 RepID=UPI003AFB3985